MAPGALGFGIVVASFGACVGALYPLQYLYSQRGQQGAGWFIGTMASLAVFCLSYAIALLVVYQHRSKRVNRTTVLRRERGGRWIGCPTTGFDRFSRNIGSFDAECVVRERNPEQISEVGRRFHSFTCHVHVRKTRNVGQRATHGPTRVSQFTHRPPLVPRGRRVHTHPRVVADSVRRDRDRSGGTRAGDATVAP